MPFPMKPTQFTVFTNASASAFKMLPWVSSIMVAWFSIVPPRPDVDNRALLDIKLTQNFFHSRFRSRVQHTDFLNQHPRAGLVNQKFRLLPPLPVHVVQIVAPIPLINHVPVHLTQMRQVIKPIGV